MKISVGLSAVGAGKMVLVFVDPEPTSKLGLLVGGGLIRVFSGGFSAIKILTKQGTPSVKIGPTGIEILWT